MARGGVSYGRLLAVFAAKHVIGRSFTVFYFALIRRCVRYR
jgi:hypothetical protein